MRTALVTGSSGFVGHHLTRHLEHAGYGVRTFDAATGEDIRDYEDIRRAIDLWTPDLVFHLAAQAFVPEATTDPRRGFDVNTLGTLNLLEAIRHTGSRARLLVAGTSAEYGYNLTGQTPITEDTLCRPDTVYGVSKLAATQLALVYGRAYGIPVVVTRACNHTGPGHQPVYAVPSFAKQVAEIEAGRRLMVSHGNLAAQRNYSDVRDIVAGYADVIHAESGIYNLGAARTVTLAEVLDTLAGLATVPIIRHMDPALYRPGMQSGPVEFPPYSTAKIAAAVAWKPQIPLAQTLADTLDFWRSQVGRILEGPQ